VAKNTYKYILKKIFMLHHRHVHHFHLLDQLKGRLGLLYFHLIIQAFAISLISIFIPIYLLELGYSLQRVFVFLLIQWAAFGLFTPIYGKIIHKIGLKEVILYRTPIYVLGLFLLNSKEIMLGSEIIFFLIPIFLGFSESLYTLSITSLFAKFMGKKDHAKKTAKLITFPKIVSIAGPLLGGFIVFEFGFSILLIAVITLLLVSVIPVYFIKHVVDYPKFNFQLFREIKFNFKELIFLKFYGMKGFLLFIILPIAIFLLNKNTLSLGFIISLISLVSAIFTLYLGKITDKFGTIKIIKYGAIFTFLLFLNLGYFYNSEILYFLSILSGFISILIDLPYETHLYEKSKNHENKPLEFLVFKEFGLFLGRLILFLLLIIIFFDAIDLAFYFGSISAVIFIFFGG
jgi:MFS family permease